MRVGRWRGVVVGLGLVALAAAGCQSTKIIPPDLAAKELVAEARERGLRLEDPMQLSPDMEHDVDVAIDHRGEPRERLHKLIRHLNDRQIGFEHVHGVSLPVQRAYHERRGDCMSYAMLFVALSRHLGLDTHFVHASEVLAFYENGDTLYASSHIAVGFGKNPDDIVVDFANEYDDWHLASYRAIDDAAAVALYFNNLAAYELNDGHAAEAEKVLSFLVEKRPNLEELHNNLIVAYLRQKRGQEALGVANKAISLFPNYKPFYTNAILAAYDLGKLDLAHHYEARAQAIVANDPLYVFAQALELYRDAQYTRAAEEFERALSGRKDSIVINAWLVRAYLSAGNRQEGIQAFARIQKLAPEDRRLKELTGQFPELRGL
ncbi:MAG TPA: tetratricopeptide repeat protein [Polyangiaceae bacterium]|nr:tetratricopeptide repeat protein [Polyangiaceae bacterium]